MRNDLDASQCVLHELILYYTASSENRILYRGL